VDAFDFLCLIKGHTGDGPDGRTHDAKGLVEWMHADPEWGQEYRWRWEHIWSHAKRASTIAWIECLTAAARYLSNLVGGDVPFLVPRDLVEDMVGTNHMKDPDALLIGKAVHRTIQKQVQAHSQIAGETILTEIQRLFTSTPTQSAPIVGRYLDTKQIGVRLCISEVTAARLCRSGLIDADKTSGNQWRTTERRLRGSPYLVGKTKRGGNNGKLE
jgi:hypothetical protein